MEEVHDRNVPDAPLDAGNVRPVEVGFLGQFLLRQAEGEPVLADGFSQRFSRIGDVSNHVPMVFCLAVEVHSL